MTGSEVRAMKDTEIALELKKLRMKLFDMRSQVVTGKVENTAEFGMIKRDVARLLTEQRARVHAAAGRTPGAGRKKVAKPAKARGGNKGVKKGDGAKSRKPKRKAPAAG
jgi:large subunit ribosomal protein L29